MKKPACKLRPRRQRQRQRQRRMRRPWLDQNLSGSEQRANRLTSGLGWHKEVSCRSSLKAGSVNSETTRQRRANAELGAANRRGVANLKRSRQLKVALLSVALLSLVRIQAGKYTSVGSKRAVGVRSLPSKSLGGSRADSSVSFSERTPTETLGHKITLVESKRVS